MFNNRFLQVPLSEKVGYPSVLRSQTAGFVVVAS